MKVYGQMHNFHVNVWTVIKNIINITCNDFFFFLFLAITCDHPSRPVNMGYVDESDLYTFGSKLQLKCNVGFQLYGNQFIYCLPSGKWSKILSQCSSK